MTDEHRECARVYHCCHLESWDLGLSAIRATRHAAYLRGHQDAATAAETAMRELSAAYDELAARYSALELALCPPPDPSPEPMPDDPWVMWAAQDPSREIP